MGGMPQVEYQRPARTARHKLLLLPTRAGPGALEILVRAGMPLCERGLPVATTLGTGRLWSPVFIGIWGALGTARSQIADVKIW